MRPKERVGRVEDRSGRPEDAASERRMAGGPAIHTGSTPLLMVDIDGVISLFGAPIGTSLRGPAVEGSFHSIEGIPHFLSSTAAAHLLVLADHFELVWASGWEERADEHLPHLLGLPRALPFLRFGHRASAGGVTHGHWKLEAIDAYARGRPLAWLDDALSPACHEWAAARPAPTLLVQTDPEQGLTTREAQVLARWAEGLREAR
jgi:HAD domain in Swiss Army Knife RNA repair proteins